MRRTAFQERKRKKCVRRWVHACVGECVFTHINQHISMRVHMSLRLRACELVQEKGGLHAPGSE